MSIIKDAALMKYVFDWEGLATCGARSFPIVDDLIGFAADSLWEQRSDLQ